MISQYDEESNQPRPKLRELPNGKHRVMPHAIEAEEYLLCCLMIEGAGAEVMAKCHQIRIHRGSFYDNKHGIIFAVLEELYRRQAPMDVAAVAEEMKERKELDAVGGYAFLAQVSSRVPTTAQVGFFIEKVRDTAAMRQTIREFTEGIDKVHDLTGGGRELAEMLEVKSAWVARTLDFLRSGQATMQDAAKAGFERVMSKLAGKVDKSRWLYTGLAEFDKRFTAFDVNNEDWLCIIAGLSSSGKSSLARQWVVHNLRQGKTALIFLLETSLAKWLELAACTASDISAKSLEGLPKDMQERYKKTLEEMHGYVGKTLWICDEIIPVETLTARIDDHCRRHGPPSVIVVDHMHLLRSRKPMNKREAEMGLIAKELKKVLKRVNVTGWVLAQLNRGPKADGGNRRPVMSDIRDSGEIEQAADRIVLIHTPDVDMCGREQTKNSTQVMAELVQDKHRNGPTGFREFWFWRYLTKFGDIRDAELDAARDLQTKEQRQAHETSTGQQGASKKSFRQSQGRDQ
jgi:replicative DNA helicase